MAAGFLLDSIHWLESHVLYCRIGVQGAPLQYWLCWVFHSLPSPFPSLPSPFFFELFIFLSPHSCQFLFLKTNSWYNFTYLGGTFITTTSITTLVVLLSAAKLVQVIFIFAFVFDFISVYSNYIR